MNYTHEIISQPYKGTKCFIYVNVPESTDGKQVYIRAEKWGAFWIDKTEIAPIKKNKSMKKNLLLPCVPVMVYVEPEERISSEKYPQLVIDGEKIFYNSFRVHIGLATKYREAKKDDWFERSGKLYQHRGLKSNSRPIVAITDPSLGLPLVPKSWLPELVEWYSAKGNNIENLALEKYPVSIISTNKFEDGITEYDQNKDFRNVFIESYYQALRDNQEKKYTWEHIRICWDYFVDGHYGLNDEMSFDDFMKGLDNGYNKNVFVELQGFLDNDVLDEGTNYKEFWNAKVKTNLQNEAVIY